MKALLFREPFAAALLFAFCLNVPGQAVLPPIITQQPQSQTVAEGSSVMFTVVASSASPLTYQWRFNGADIPGAMGDRLTLSEARWTNSGYYSVMVENLNGSALSTNALLTVVPWARFTNSSPISLPGGGPGAPYPSLLSVSNLAGAVLRVTVTLNNIHHPFPDDLDILLVGPGGTSVILMSDAGDGNPLNDITLTFDDNATNSLPDVEAIQPGVFKPSDFEMPDDFVTPAPPAPYGSALSVFSGSNPNGTWALYVFSDATGGAAGVMGGWSLDIVMDTPPPGSMDFSFAGSGANGPVRAVVAQPDGKVLIGGQFTAVNGVTRYRVARLNFDGSLDTEFNAGTISGTSVLAIALLPDGKVCIGGDFTSVGGMTRHSIAALNAITGAPIPSWNPSVTNGTVFALLVSGSKLYLGGDFTSVGGQPRNGIACLNATNGSVTPWNPDADGPVKALAVSGNVVYAGGGFTFIGHQPRNRLAALDEVTGDATSWDPDADGIVSALAVFGGSVYVGGGFTNIGSQPRDYLATLDETTGEATFWNPDADGLVHALSVPGGKAYVGGNFATLNGVPRNSITRLNVNGTVDTGFDPGSGANAPVFAVAPQGNAAVFIGGDFTMVNGIPRNHIARLHASASPFSGSFAFTSFFHGPDGFHCQLMGPPAVYILEASSDLLNWTAIATNGAPSGSVDLLDPNAGSFPARFYRAVTY